MRVRLFFCQQEVRYKLVLNIIERSIKMGIDNEIRISSEIIIFFKVKSIPDNQRKKQIANVHLSIH